MFFKNTKSIALSLALFAGFLSLSVQTAQAKEVKSTYNGLTVNANVVLAEGKTLADEVVLLTHGTTTHNGRETYRVIQRLLAESGISSVAPNLSLDINDRHGEVDCTALQSHTHDDAMAEIGFWVKWLDKQGATSITLMGHSRGANQTAWYSAEHDSDLIKNVVLIAPQTWSKEAEHKSYEKKYHVALQPLLDKAEKLVKAGKGDTQLKNINFIYCEGATATAEAFASYYRDDQRMDTPFLLKKSTKPTLVIIGSADTVVADLTDKMATVNNPLVSSYIIEGSNHFFLDFFSDELVEQAVSFIQQ
jgi:pimeloyl-ACP methyl ester carboxylesterase